MQVMYLQTFRTGLAHLHWTTTLPYDLKTSNYVKWQDPKTYSAESFTQPSPTKHELYNYYLRSLSTFVAVVNDEGLRDFATC